jgi:hypothetical protein
MGFRTMIRARHLSPDTAVGDEESIGGVDEQLPDSGSALR